MKKCEGNGYEVNTATSIHKDHIGCKTESLSSFPKLQVQKLVFQNLSMSWKIYFQFPKLKITFQKLNKLFDYCILNIKI